MHVYIYDSFLNQKKYDNILAKLETRLTDLGLNGKIFRLGIMKNIREIVIDELKRGATTIIAVGNNKTVNQVVNSLSGFNVPLGIIPIDNQENNSIATSLGIDNEQIACEILSARRITRIDLGLASNRYFLATAAITCQETILEISKNYSIEIIGPGEIKLINLPINQRLLLTKEKSNPQDGTLELVIKTATTKRLFNKQFNQSIFSVNKILIRNKKFPILLDGTIPIAPPAEIRVIKQKLKVIVGRNRRF